MRPTDVPDQGLLCDLLWSDPDKDTMGWGENDRGVSFTFGAEVCNKTFCESLEYGKSFIQFCCFRLWVNFFKNTSLTLYVVPIKLLKMVMSSLPSASWSHYFRPPITAVNLTMRVSDH